MVHPLSHAAPLNLSAQKHVVEMMPRLNVHWARFYHSLTCPTQIQARAIAPAGGLLQSRSRVLAFGLTSRRIRSRLIGAVGTD